jgi:EF-P beta-lysylation protein EpmB
MLWNKESQQIIKGASNANKLLGKEMMMDGSFPIKIPKEFFNLIDLANPDDPLLKQVSPVINEGETQFKKDPLDDNQFSKIPGLIHKYINRALIIASRSCSIHCQYCFRKNFEYKVHDIFSNLEEIVSYLKSHIEIDEVILSGGDPFTLSDEKLKQIIDPINDISHIKTIRFHTRTLVVIPGRIRSGFINYLKGLKLNIVIVFHINHPNEIGSKFINFIKELEDFRLLNQSVLLKGVNDNSETLKALSIKLFEIGILPYYLHLLDEVEGSEHFFISEKDAKSIHKNLQKLVSGYLVPRLVKDENLESKTWK